MKHIVIIPNPTKDDGFAVTKNLIAKLISFGAEVYIENKLISLGGNSKVYNEEQQQIYNVEGKVVSPTRKKFIYDMQGNLLYVVRNKYWTFFTDKSLVYDANGDKLATIKKNKFSFNLKYQIEDTPEPMEIVGKFFTGTSNIMKNDQQIGVIHREFSIMNDCYSLEANEEDIPFLTALVVAFDNLIDKKNKESRD